MIYLDNHATTACDPQVVAAMLPYFTASYGNPSSPHEFGQVAAAAVRIAQAQVAYLVGAEAKEIVFTSGATESNNLALLGVTRQYAQRGGTRRRIVTTAIEHKSVLAPLQHLAEQGWDLVYLPVDSKGRVDLKKARELITGETLLVSVQAASSEIGTLQPVAELAEFAHSQGALMHCDASQAVGKIALSVAQLQVDLLSMSGHKMYGPKGIGVLWLKGGSQCLPLVPLMYGGEQANGLRPGTLPVSLIVGLGTASKLAAEHLLVESQRTATLRDAFEERLREEIRTITINGAIGERLPNNASITFAGLDAEALLANLPGVLASTGAACESGSVEPSRVLTSLGLTREQAFSTIRFGFGRFTTTEEMHEAATQVIEAHRQLAFLLV